MNNDPTPGTQQLSQKVDSSIDSNSSNKAPSSILKEGGAELTEEEQLRRNTHNNRKKSVGIVASSISKESNKVRKGSAYGLTKLDRYTKHQQDEEDPEIRRLLQEADNMKRDAKNKKRPTGVEVITPPAKLRSKRQARLNDDPEREATLDRIQYALNNIPA